MSGSNLVQSLVRGLDILELVAQSESGLTLSEIASILGVRRPTAFNLARTLVLKGYLEKHSRPARYTLGSGVASVYRTYESRGWRSRAEEALRRLVSVLGDAQVFIVEPSSGDVQISFRIDPSRPTLVNRPLGRLLVPYTMAGSLCFQAFWSSVERERYEAQYPFAEYGRGMWGNRGTLDAYLAMSRRKGCVDRRTSGLHRLFAPVYGIEGQLVAAVGAVRDLGEEEDREQQTAALIKEVLASADALSQT